MNDRDFERKILDMENEVRALKTAHERGLGAFEFYSIQQTFSITPSPFLTLLNIAVTVEEEEPVPAFVQLYLNYGTLPMQSVALSSDNRSIVYKLMDIFPDTLTVRAVSPSKLASIAVEVQS